MKLTKKQKKKLKKLVKIMSYAIEWAQPSTLGTVAERDSYELGVIESVAHQIACFLTKEDFLPNGCGTGEVRDILKLDRFPSQKKLLRRLIYCLEDKKLF